MIEKSARGMSVKNIFIYFCFFLNEMTFEKINFVL